MKLFKNVDIQDLKSIVDLGILPVAKLGFSNWEYDNRANNSKDVVYLFNPLNEINSFVTYGLILLEVDVDNVTPVEIADNDFHQGKYEEFVVDEVTPAQIVKIYAPRVLKDKIEGLDGIKIEWVDVDFEAKYSTNTSPYLGNVRTEENRVATESDQRLWSEFAELNSNGYNYLIATKWTKFPEKNSLEPLWKEYAAESISPNFSTFKYKI